MLGTAPGASLHPDYPLIRTPRRYLTPFSLSPVLLGLANRALALVMEGTRKKVAGGALPPDFDTLQLRVAETAADLDAANTLFDTLKAQSAPCLIGPRLCSPDGRMLEAGANVVQIYTGLIYKGPKLVHEVAHALHQLSRQ